MSYILTNETKIPCIMQLRQFIVVKVIEQGTTSREFAYKCLYTVKSLSVCLCPPASRCVAE